jgi:hypothetical protein
VSKSAAYKSVHFFVLKELSESPDGHIRFGFVIADHRFHLQLFPSDGNPSRIVELFDRQFHAVELNLSDGRSGSCHAKHHANLDLVLSNNRSRQNKETKKQNQTPNTNPFHLFSHDLPPYYWPSPGNGKLFSIFASL